jgi:hypothetical protein
MAAEFESKRVGETESWADRTAQMLRSFPVMISCLAFFLGVGLVSVVYYAMGVRAGRPLEVFAGGVVGGIAGYLADLVLLAALRRLRMRYSEAYAPVYLRKAFMNGDYDKIALLAGTLGWVEEPRYVGAWEALRDRGTAGLTIFYEPVEHIEKVRKDPRMAKAVRRRVCNLISEFGLGDPRPNPGEPHIEGILTPDRFGIIVHEDPFIGASKWYRVKAGEEPDFFHFYTDRRLIDAMWHVVEGHKRGPLQPEDDKIQQALTALFTEPDVAEVEARPGAPVEVGQERVGAGPVGEAEGVAQIEAEPGAPTEGGEETVQVESIGEAEAIDEAEVEPDAAVERGEEEEEEAVGAELSVAATEDDDADVSAEPAGGPKAVPERKKEERGEDPAPPPAS